MRRHQAMSCTCAKSSQERGHWRRGESSFQRTEMNMTPLQDILIPNHAFDIKQLAFESLRSRISDHLVSSMV
jgi:hypothetical protein